MKTILLKFSAPIQSWGTSSHFETRHTEYHPSKSAVIGMIMAAFGIRRSESENKLNKFNELEFATRIDKKGKLLRDFHTAKSYKNDGEFNRTYVTNRYYIEDAIYIVAVGHKDESFIEEIKEALENPYFQLYLGRKSVPINADYILCVEDDTVLNSIKKLPDQSKDYNSKMSNKRYEVYIDSNLVDVNQKSIRNDRAISFNKNHRKYGFRSESKIYIEIKNYEKEFEHDVFSALGGEDVSYTSKD